jgi:hypothetical protein
MSARLASLATAPESPPDSRRAGSPGTARTARKIAVSTTKTSAAAEPMRRITNEITVVLLLRGGQKLRAVAAPGGDRTHASVDEVGLLE